ncbi:MAG: bifunctional isocitrate dehydrogenase kinase/phosphatase, partial [Chthoniobacterales bacterium]|nr:bifunctional isocitrate dehydrogenase kinase/phosphatase [Chthoniobacterales bacterium]
MSGGTISPAVGTLTDSRLATICAEKAEHAFRDYEEGFLAITRRARERFLTRDWSGTYADAAERLHLYGKALDRLTSDLESVMEARLQERNVWTAIKAVYSSLIARRTAWEIAESFFNSLTRRIFATEGVDQAIEFVDTD